MAITEKGADALAGMVADSAILNASLRDLFAAFALAGLIQADFARLISHPDEAATDAYTFADAVMAQRKG